MTTPASHPTVGEWLQANTKLLQEAGIESARLDCLILLEHQLNTNRALLLAHPERPLPPEVTDWLDTAITKRCSHTPLAYITGHTEFYGRNFFVSPEVLVPRPESEAIFTLLGRIAQPKIIIDIGTGSGALAITAKSLTTEAEVYALDIDPGCLQVAARNATLHQLAIHVLQSDLLRALPQQLFTPETLLLANLPYVPADYPINQAARHEPALALYGGVDGLDLYRNLFGQLGNFPSKPLGLICESLLPQHDALQHIATAAGYRLAASEGLQQYYVPAT